jgi:hypothetical protein
MIRRTKGVCEVLFIQSIDQSFIHASPFYPDPRFCYIHVRTLQFFYFSPTLIPTSAAAHILSRHVFHILNYFNQAVRYWEVGF